MRVFLRIVDGKYRIEPGEEATLTWSVTYAESALVRTPEGEELPIPLAGEWTVSHPEGSFEYSIIGVRGEEKKVLGSQTLTVVAPNDWEHGTGSFSDIEGGSYWVAVTDHVEYVTADWPYDDDTASLLVRCSQRLGSEVIVDWGGQYVAGSRNVLSVQYRLDGGAIRHTTASESSDNEAMFVRLRPGDLVGHSTFEVQAYDYSDDRIGPATFHIRGLAKILDPEC